MRDEVASDQMIPVADIVDSVATVVGLSARSVVPRIMVSQAGASAYGA